LELEHCIVNIWYDMKPQMIEILPDREYCANANEYDLKAFGKDNRSINVRIIEAAKREAEQDE